MRIVRLLSATALSALLYALAFPPTSWKGLAWVALVPLFVALRTARVGTALALGVVWTVLMTWATSDWLPPAVSTYFLQPQIVGALFFVGIIFSMVTPYYAAFAPTYRPLTDRFGPWAPLLVAASWVAVELVRGRLFNGALFYFGTSPWATFGYSQVGNDSLVQIASVVGVYGISFALVACNAGVAQLLLALRKRRALREAGIGLGLAALPTAVVLGFGAFSLRGAPPMTADTQGVEIAIVQANLPLGSRWRSDRYGQNLDAYLKLTREAFDGAQPEIVFWPEAAMTFFLESEPTYRRFLARDLSALSAELVGGAPRHDDTSPPRYWNSVYLISESGEIVARYDKRHLVPFMEYFPFGIDLLRRSFGRVREFEPGAPVAPLPTRAGPAGVLICNEAMLPHFAARRVAEGAAYLINPSNDSWAPDLKFALHQFDIVSLRAVEQGRYLVRASTSGPSAIVDPWGRVSAATEPFASEALVGRIRPLTARTVYGRVGDLFGLLCLVGTAFALLLTRRRR